MYNIEYVKKGKLIVFEGIDGAGKTTQAQKLKEKLIEVGKKVVLTAEPTESSLGIEIRKIINNNSEYSKAVLPGLILADRINHNVNSQNGIIEYVNNGYYVICDRYYYSNMVYQGTDCGGIEWVKYINIECPYILKPDMCIVLKIDHSIAIQRMNSISKKKDMYETESKLLYAEDVYNNLGKYLDDNIVYVDADYAEEKVHQIIWENILKIL